MILLLTGIVLLLLGLFSGVVLVAAPLGWAAWEAGIVLWVLFPAFTITGYVLAVIGGRSSQFRGLSLILSGLLLMLALVSGAGLVLEAAGVAKAAGSTLSLWYVLFVAGMVGVIGAAASGTIGPQTGAQA
jgi:hypothetical protein